ncbi:hypothetical protein I4U23_020420 [Adineta vaga]|nr:hypothetical protein I4U23_020420 [Adineta vaga]
MSSNISTTTVSSDLIQAGRILPICEEYLIVMIYIFGFIGSLLNIFIFLQKRLRIKSCSIYFLLCSFVDFSFLNSFMLMHLISLFNLKPFSSINSTNFWCKLGNYFYFLLPCLTSTYLILTSIDRFCASSSNNKLQKLNQLKTTYLLTLFIFFIWISFALHIPIDYNLIQLSQTNNTQCTPSLNNVQLFVIIDGYFFALYNGIITPFFLVVFGLLILRNIKLIHRRTNPQLASTMILEVNHQINIRLTRGNQHLITMLLVQVSLTVLLNIPYITFYLYGIYNSTPRYWLSLLIYRICTYIARWFWFMNFSKSFYVNICSSQIFRNILKRRIIQLFFFGECHRNQVHQIISQQIQRQLSSNSDYNLELTRR